VTDAITVWRLNARRFSRAALSGNGAFRYGGRWNLPGTRVVYCAESRALAALEALIHVEDIEDLCTVEWQATAITLSSAAIERPLRYPQSWRTYPYTSSTQRFGSTWAQNQHSVALRVPSAVVPGEFNYLINPMHPDFAKLRIERPEPFRFDPRLPH
jgi:RES domain-containing protein